jgi:hypothetical protein
MHSRNYCQIIFQTFANPKDLCFGLLQGIHSSRHNEFVVIAKSFMQNIATNNTVKGFIAKTCESKYLHFEVKF